MLTALLSCFARTIEVNKQTCEKRSETDALRCVMSDGFLRLRKRVILLLVDCLIVNITPHNEYNVG